MKRFILLAILVLGFFFRTYTVSLNPPSLSWDEVSIGYNAYSILKTGRDEHGRFLPLDSFISYGDYKPPLAIYSAVPFVLLFGLTDLSVRLPAAVFGTLSLFITYLIVIELFKTRLTRTTSFDEDRVSTLALLTTLVMAVSPWHVNISRGGFEANIALFFVLLGVWCILSARQVVSRYLYMWLPFVAAMYTFNSARYFVPLLSPPLIWFSLEHVRKNRGRFILGVLIAILAMVPILPHLVSKEARLRFKEVNIFSDTAVIEQANERTQRAGNSIFSPLVNNRRVGFIRSYLMHFTDNLQPEFLFIRGDGNPKFSIQDTGQLYIIEAPLMVIGFFALFAAFPIQAGILLFWLLAAMVPAATARETPHALRILNSLPVWYIAVAFGCMVVYDWWKRSVRPQFFFRVGITIFLAVYILQVGYYLHQYYAHFPKEFSGEWQYGYREAISLIRPMEKNYDSVVVTDSIGRPYMYTAFYTETDPGKFVSLKRSYVDDAGFYHVDGFGKYSFVDTVPLSLGKNTLYIWDATEVPQGARVLHTIKLLNGEPRLVLFDAGEVEK